MAHSLVEGHLKVRTRKVLEVKKLKVLFAVKEEEVQVDVEVEDPVVAKEEGLPCAMVVALVDVGVEGQVDGKEEVLVGAKAEDLVDVKAEDLADVKVAVLADVKAEDQADV